MPRSSDTTSDEEDMEEEEEEVTTTSAGRVYKHVLPRIDPDSYQCSVPDGLLVQSAAEAADAAKNASINWYKGTRGVSSGLKSNEKSIEEFLVHVRNMFEPSRFRDEEHWTADSVQACPLESDAEAIEFLADHDYNVDKAIFHMSTLMSYGKDLVHTRKASLYVEKFPLAAMFHETKEKMFRAGAQKQMLGAYVNLEMEEKVFAPMTEAQAFEEEQANRGAGKGPYSWENQRDYFKAPFPRDFAEGRHEPLVPRVEEKDENGESTDKKSKKVLKVAEKDKAAEQDQKEKPAEDTSTSRSARTGVVDKQEAKKRWMSILNAGAKLTAKPPPVVPGAPPPKIKRGTIEEVLALLEEASSLPPFTDSPGDDFAEVLRSSLAELMRHTMDAREYVAKVRDALAPHYATYGKRANVFMTIADLKKLQAEGSELSVSTPEEKQLRDIINAVEKVNRFAKKLQSKSGVKINEEMLFDDDNDDGTNKWVTKKDANSEDKLTMEEVSDQLRMLKALPLERTATKALEDVYYHALRVIDEASEYVETANALRNRTKLRGFGEPNRPLEECKKLMDRMSNFPLDLKPYLVPLERLYNGTLVWREEVLNLCKAGQTGARASATADGNKPGSSSIKRVEALINEGERMVFDVTEELEALKDKRAQAKEWLEKLKKSFAPKTGRSGSLRKNNLDSTAAVPIERLALADMKMMVHEGELLYEDEEGDGRSRTIRELSRAQSVVDVAEEWLARVREALSDSSGNINVSEMKNLLGESEGMPVFMEEAVVLRVHLQALEWAKKAKHVLYELDEDEDDDEDEDEDDEDRMDEEGKGDEEVKAPKERVFARPKLIEMQRLAKEIRKIREELPEAIREEFSLKPLPEERDCLQTVKAAEEFTSTMKKLFQANIPKKGIKLEHLRELFKKVITIPLQLDNEMRPLKTAIRVCENWIFRNAHILQKIGIPCNLVRTVDIEYQVGSSAGDGDGEDDDEEDKEKERAPKANSSAVVVAAPTAEASAEISIEDWRRLISSADHIALDFDELTTARTQLEEMEEWLNQVQDKVPKRFFTQQQQQALQQQTKPRGKDKTQVVVASPPPPPVRSSVWPSKALVKRAQIEDLLRRGDNLRLDLKREKQLVKDSLTEADKWNEDSAVALNSILTTGVRDVLSKLREMSVKSIDSVALAFKGINKEVSSDFLNLRSNLDDEEPLDEQKLLADLLTMTKAGVTARQKLDEFNFGTDGHASREKFEEELVWADIKKIRAQVEALQQQGEENGIAVPSTLLIDVSISTLNWVEDARDMLNPPFRSKPLKDREGRPLEKPLNWGDIKKEYIMLMIDDALSVVSPDVRAETLELLKDTRLGTAPQNVADALADHTRIKEEIWPEEKTFMFIFARKPARENSKGKNAAKPPTPVKEKEILADEMLDSDDDDEGTVEAAEVIEEDVDQDAMEQEDAEEAEVPEEPSFNAEYQEEEEEPEQPVAPKEDTDKLPPRKKGRTQRKDPDFVSSEIIGSIDLMEGRPARKRQRSTLLDEDAGQAEPPKKPKSSKGKQGAAEFKDEPLPLPPPPPPKAAKVEKADKVEKVEKAEDKAEKESKVVAKEVKVVEPIPAPPSHHFGMFRKLMANQSMTVPLPLQKLVDFYVRCLGLLLVRIFESEQWASMSSAITTRAFNASPGAAGKQCVDECLFLLDWANSRGIESASRLKLEDAILKVEEWVERVNAMRRRQMDSLLNLDDLRDFIKAGDKLLFDRTETAELREESKKAKAWVKKLIATGIEKGTASSQDLQALLPEVDNINVDLSQHIDSIYSAVKTYCLCRQAYFGQMIGCDTCEDWYHLQCIGVTQAQADKFDKFCCIRCNIKSSFEFCQNTVGTISNKWMNMSELKKEREYKKQKLQKATQRFQKEVERLEKKLDESTRANLASAAAPAPAPAPAASPAQAEQPPAAEASAEEAMDVVPPAAAADDAADAAAAGEGLPLPPPPPASSQQAQQPVGKSIADELEDARKRLEASLRDEATANELVELELSHQKEIVSWMQKVQIALWPSNIKEADYGRPCGRDVIPATHSFSVEEVQERAMNHMRTNLLPPYIFDLARHGIEAGIGDIEDIVTVVEAFRWMSWCNVTMQVMRLPITTILLRKLISASEGLKMVDDKLLRFFRNLNLRSANWKSKARRLIAQSTPCSMETPKLNGLLLEGNQIPISSRIKDILRAAMEKVVAVTKPHPGEEGFVIPAIDPDTALAANAKRPLKAITGAPPGMPPIAAMSHDPLQYHSSDDESKPRSGLLHAGLSQHLIAPPPKVWPPIIPFPRGNGQQPLAPAPVPPSYSFDQGYGNASDDVPSSSSSSSSLAAAVGSSGAAGETHQSLGQALSLTAADGKRGRKPKVRKD